MIFLNRFFYPDHSATSQMLSELALALAGSGRHVTIITSRQLYNAPRAILPAAESFDGVEIIRVWSSRFGRFHLFGRTVDYLTFYLSAAWRLWRIARAGDLVIAKTDPPMLSIVAEPIARLRGARLVNWLQDLFPEVASQLGVGHGRVSRLAYLLMQCLRDQSLRRAMMSVAIGERMARRLAEIGVPSDRIRVIGNWADGVLVQPVDPAANRLRTDWSLQRSFVVGYSGNLGRAHDASTIAAAIAELEQQGETGIAWLFIGGGAQYEHFRIEVSKRKLASVQFKPYQARGLLAQSLSVPDIHLVTLRPALEGLIVPSKIYGILAAGRASIFIGDPDGEVSRLLLRHDCGLVVEEGDGEGLARMVIELSRDPKRCAAMGARARVAFEKLYDKPIAMAKWEALFRELDVMPPAR